MKKLLIAFLCLVSNLSFAITDQEIANRSGKQFTSCLKSGKHNLNCLDEYKQQIYQMANFNSRTAAINFSNGLYELFVKLNRNEFKSPEDAKIELHRLESTYNREFQAGVNQSRPVYVQQDNTQQLFNQANQLLNPQYAPVTPPTMLQPGMLNRNCGNVITQRGQVAGFITCN